MSELSDKILKAIEDSNLSYGELSKITNIPKSALQRYATGTTDKVPINRLEAIAKATGVTGAYLMGWKEEPHRSNANIFIMDNLNKIMSLKKITKQDLLNSGNIPKDEINKLFSSGKINIKYLTELSDILEVSQKYLTEYYPDEITSKKLKKQKDLKLSMKIGRLLMELNHEGKREAYKRIEELTYIPKYAAPDSSSKWTMNLNTGEIKHKKDVEDNKILKAAHQRTDKESTEEDQKHDDDIMNDDSEWE